MLGRILGWLAAGPLDRILGAVDRRVDSKTERERLRSEALTAYVQAQAAIAGSRQYWFPLFFLIPAGLHYGAVAVYSVLFCRGCAFPQDWAIAALPPPFDEWQGLIVTSLFIGKAGETLIGRLRR